MRTHARILISLACLCLTGAALRADPPPGGARADRGPEPALAGASSLGLAGYAFRGPEFDAEDAPRRTPQHGLAASESEERASKGSMHVLAEVPGTEPPSAAESGSRRQYRIRTGDILSISIPFEANTQRTVPVRPDGRINYLFDIEVMAAGLTYRELNDALRRELARYYKNPQVTVIGKSFGGNSVFVMGPVREPGRHVIQNDTRLLDVLSQAGAMGVLPEASLAEERPREVVDLEAAYLARDGRILDVDFKQLLEERDLSQNVLLRPRDFIYLPSTLSTDRKVFVVGAVREPLVYRFAGRVTFLEAIAAAEGMIDGQAWSRRCFVIRGGIKEPREVLRVNYADLAMGRASDVELEAGDVVYVPKTPLFYTNEVLSSVLAPLNTVLQLDNIAKNRFREGDRQWKHIITKSRLLGTH